MITISNKGVGAGKFLVGTKKHVSMEKHIHPVEQLDKFDF